MQRFAQSPTDPTFVQDPYPFYDRLRAAGPLAFWTDYDMPVAASHAVVGALLRDRRFGRDDPFPPPRPAHQAAFWAVEDHSMLELEPPRHTALRGQVLRAFTSRRIAAMAPGVDALCHTLIDGFPGDPSVPFDLLDAYARPLPVRVIARLLGVPEADAPDLLRWSNAMVGMYRANRDRSKEEDAATAARDFTGYLADMFRAPVADTLVADLLAVERDGQLSRAELTATCILLLNAGHEATVHTLGNVVAGLCAAGLWSAPVTPATVEEVLRHDPPLHMFTRYAMQDVEAFGHAFARGDRVGLLLAAANRDPDVYAHPARLDPARHPKAPAHHAFGAGLHFCLGAPLARLELSSGLAILRQRCPDLRVATPPRYADIYHFHGLQRLDVIRDGQLPAATPRSAPIARQKATRSR